MERIEEALAKLSSSDWSVRVDAVGQLATFDDDRARQALVDALYDSDDSAVTEAAVEAMLATGDERFIEPLLKSLTGGRPELSDDQASEVAEDVSGVLERRRDSPIATDVLRREAETNPPPEKTLEEIQERHRRWRESNA